MWTRGSWRRVSVDFGGSEARIWWTLELSSSRIPPSTEILQRNPRYML